MEARDPVCGMSVDTDAPEATAKLAGRTYYFCSEECRDTFFEDPEGYLQELEEEEWQEEAEWGEENESEA